MARFRSYLAAQAALLRNNGTSASRNPIIELSYGGSAAAVEETKVSRFAFQPDLSALRGEVESGRLRQSEVTKHELFFKNVIALAPDLLETRVEDARRGSGVTVELYQLAETEIFEEGKGYDYLYHPGTTLQNRASTQAANWYYRKNGQHWSNPGAYNASDSILLGEVRVGEGTEDLRFDITSYVQGVLFEGKPETSLLLRLDNQTEALLDERRYVITFFSRYTHHWFEPFLETIYEPVLNEHRCAVPLDEPARLFLQLPANLTAIPTAVNIYNTDQQLIQTIGLPVQSRPGLYHVDFTFSSLIYADGEVYYDEWEIVQGSQVKKIAQKFSVTDRLYATIPDSFDKVFSLSVAGLRHNENISRQQSAKPRRVLVNYRMLQNGQVQTGCGCSPTQVVYRVYCTQGKEQMEVIPYTSCYELAEALFLELDARWLIPQYYVLELVALASDGQQQSSPLSVKFRVVN